MYDPETNFHNECVEWAIEQVYKLSDETLQVSPSEWAEENRYLPDSVTPLPGYYSYDVSPPLKEIVDCGDIRSPVREVTLMKGAQIGATVGVFENLIGYGMEILKSSPMMFLTADGDLAKLRLENYIQPMIQQSNLTHLIKSTDELSNRRSGLTQKKIQWYGGGSLVPFGAQNANKLRSISIQYLLEDETDGYPINVGKQGCPCALAEGRTKAYYQSRKIFRLSTPLIKKSSKIEEFFKQGDQRYYHVPCKKCGKKQVLKFQGVNKEDGTVYGLVWQTDDEGELIVDSVRYVCQFCGHEHINADKISMLKNGEWIAKRKTHDNDVRSYHLSALYAPAMMYPWSAIVANYLKAWDVKNNRVKDIEKLQEFYNNDLGESFEIRGNRLKLHQVSNHRRSFYRSGEIPNKDIEPFSGVIELLLCSVDVHDKHLNVAIFGFTQALNIYLIRYTILEGDCSNLQDPQTWDKLREILESQFVANDGKKYGISSAVIDASYMTDTVSEFCSEFDSVFPIMGRSTVGTSKKINEFTPFVTKMGEHGFLLPVDYYKDRLSAILRRTWDGVRLQPAWFFNVPEDTPDKALRELTVEYKREIVKQADGKTLGYEWFRPKGADNELWDLSVYCIGLLEILRWDLLINVYEYEEARWGDFFAIAQEQGLYYTSGG